MVKKTVLDRFVKFGGYDIIKQKKGKWKNISEASRRTGLSRPTIYAILEAYPEPPSKTIPKYVEEFRESEGYRRIKALYGKKLKHYKTMETIVIKAWKFLQKKEPLTWTEDDFRKLWNELFYDEELRGCDEHNATHLHNLMRAIDRHDLLKKFKGTKRPMGGKKQWFLEDEDIILMLPFIDYADVLIMLNLGIVKGARVSSMLKSKVKDLHPNDNTMTDYEPKRKQFVTRFIPTHTMRLLQKYVKDKDLKPDDLLFPHGYAYYNVALRNAGKKAGLKKNISTHIMKHTFVSQAHRHGVSSETVEQQTGTESRTIKRHYRARDEKKIRHELLGIPTDVIPFHQWIATLQPYFNDRYAQISGVSS